MLELADITFRYESNPILNQLNFSVQRGKIHVLLGEHGSGKSTLAKLICGLLKPENGRMIFDDQIIKKLTYREARKFGIEFVPQQDDMLVPLTVFENFFMLSDKKRSKTKNVTEEVFTFLQENGFSFDLDTRVTDLNPQDRVALDILKHIYCSPRLLVLDEVLDKLENQMFLKVIPLLSRLKNEGAGILIVSYQINTLYDYADTFSIIRRGEIILNRSVSSIDRLSLIKLAYMNTQKQVKGDMPNTAFQRLLRANFHVLLNIPIKLVFLDHQQNILLLSDAAKSYFSRVDYDDIGLPLEDFLSDDSVYSRIVDYCGDDSTNLIYNVPITRNGEKRLVDIVIYPVQVDNYRVGDILIINDITAKEFLKQQLILKEKLSSIGLLAMGVAHEINNPLDIVLKCIDLLELSELNDQQKELVQDIETEIDSISKIVDTLMSTSDSTERDLEVFNFNELVKNVVKQVSRLASEMRIAFSLNLSEENILIEANPTQIKLVLLDLIKNSFEAIENSGLIQLSTSLVYSNEKPFLLFVIKDNGKGFDVESVDDIFLPFFSTKDSLGKNLGLGLYNSYNVIKDHDGEISMENNHDRGVSFRIKLPAISTVA